MKEWEASKRKEYKNMIFFPIKLELAWINKIKISKKCLKPWAISLNSRFTLKLLKVGLIRSGRYKFYEFGNTTSIRI